MDHNNTAENSKFINPWSNPYFITPTWLILMLGGIFMYYIIYSNWENSFPYFFLSIFYFIFYIYLINIGYGFFSESYEVVIFEDQIKGIGLYGQIKKMALGDILKVEETWSIPLLIHPSIAFTSRSNPDKRILINGSLLNFGELVEKVLDKAANCEEVKIEKLPYLNARNQGWQKEPDWELINRAKQRAEENRSKQSQ